MSPQDFIANWGPGGPAFELNERQGAQAHFMDLCQLLGVPKPGSSGDYIFEQDTLVLGEARGYADVFMRNHFAWENKAPGKSLDTALKQLLTYSLALSNPPLLVVCDRLTIRIHTQFNGHPSEVHTVLLGELDQPAKQALLRRLWTDPESFRPKKTSRDITEAAARSFATLADGLRKRDNDPDEVAHFLTQCLFCFFAEDVGLLPARMFEGLVNNKQLTADKLTRGLTNLFIAMCDGGLYGNDDIPWFNGGLFKKVKVPALSIMEVTELRNAAALNWSAIDVSIFGTLFERGLDPAKRSQLGAHYTDPATILRIIEPVLSRPLLQKWELVAQDIRALLSKSKKKGDKHYQGGKARFVLWLEDLRNYRVLDPACGSGNFLFMGLKALKDIEHKSHLDAAMCGLDREADLVTGPHNVLGIELNEYAAELARVTVWIGELQWRMAHGYEFKTNPVLEPLDHIECRDALLTFPVELGSDPDFAKRNSGSDPNSTATVETLCPEPGPRAGQTPGAHTLRFLKSPPTSAPPTPLDVGSPVDVEEPGAAEVGSDPDFAQQNSGSDPGSAGVREAIWPKANVVIGNPPFLGGSKKRRELGDDYFKALDTVFSGRVPGGADLVCYWFDKARIAIESDGLEAAGLVATQSIRAGSNRAVLTAICATAKIVDAWSDESWVNEGAAVRVSLICFAAAVPEKSGCQNVMLNGQTVAAIHADLTGGNGLNLTEAHPLPANGAAAFKGAEKSGPFEIDGALARQWLSLPNPHGRSNAEVLLPWRNGSDMSDRPKDHWVIDYGVSTALVDAALYQEPFSYVTLHVKPERELNNDRGRRENWWRFGRNGADMRQGVKGLIRYVVTPRVAKYRYFSWLPVSVSPDSRLLIVARADDTTFGILSSRTHEAWSLAQASMHGVGNDPTYNAKSCFETFPFPAGLTPADTAHQQTELLETGALIPAQLQEQPLKAGVARMSGAILKSEAYEPPASEPALPGQGAQNLRQAAIQIANAAKKLNDLREHWLNPPEWTHKVPEVTPLGLDKSPYPDRIEPKPGITEADLKALQKRTLTNLYNARPAWLSMAHQQLDQAVAAAYGWTDYTPAMPDDEILKRLLALNLARSDAMV
ncbi:DNA methyltransferase [Rhodoferax sp.]|uniref:class I SAM-dependent DNA methyltransferase n=1 Tax=Rhodoferax sp. TaxID=50421 RepID=UPI0026063D35|nr:DNA methyltransferase [Rhodoferax sp.]MDD2918060.1 hypothetical protein [Rhodoferax sp.]